MTGARRAFLICAAAATAAAGVAVWCGLRGDPNVISGAGIAAIPLPPDAPPPLIDIAAIPTGAVAVYGTNAGLTQLHHFHAPEDGLFPVERRDIGGGRDVLVDRIYYDADGVVRKVATGEVTRTYPEGRCEATLGACRYKARHEEGGTWGVVLAETSIEGDRVRRRLDLGAGAMTVTYSVSNRWGIAKTAEWAGDNGAYSAIELVEIRLP